MKAIFLLCAFIAALGGDHASAGTPRSNVVYLMADDLGWSDISANPGGTIPTPNIDRLFSQGPRK